MVRGGKVPQIPLNPPLYVFIRERKTQIEEYKKINMVVLKIYQLKLICKTFVLVLIQNQLIFIKIYVKIYKENVLLC